MVRRGRVRPRGAFGIWWFWHAVLGILAATTAGLIGGTIYQQSLYRAAASTEASQYTPPPLDNSNPVLSPTVAFLGDSYIQGTGSSSPAKTSWVARLSAYENWTPKNLGCGGSGYLNPGPYCKKGYQDRISEVAAANPAIVFVAGGRNDVFEETGAEAKAIAKTFDSLRAALPHAKIYAVSPVWDATTPPDALATIQSRVKAAAAKDDITYLDIGEPLRGKSDEIYTDGIHPNDAGHAALASATEAALTKLGVRPVKVSG